MKKMTVAIVVCLLVPAFAFAQAGESNKPAKKPTVTDLLTKHVESIEWEDVSLEEIIDWLKERMPGVNVVPKLPALEVIGVDLDSTVTLTLGDVRVKTVLDEVMEQLSEGAVVTYQGEGNILKISTKSDFDRKKYVRVYPISDLIVKVRMFDGPPSLDLTQPPRTTGGAGGGESIFTDDDDDEEDEDIKAQDAELLIEWVLATVEPESWVDNGGTGTISFYLTGQASLLIVNNTVSVHQELAGMLAR